MEFNTSSSAEVRLAAQLGFVRTLDRLKGVLRRNTLHSGARLENSAEHSWHLALAVLVLSEHATAPLDLFKAVKMALVHDVVEILAGDTFVYDAAAMADKVTREREAARALFGTLPSGQDADLRALWEDFEAGESAEARFVQAIDRLLPVMAITSTRGQTWMEQGVSLDAVLAKNASIGAAVPVLSARVENWIRGVFDHEAPC